MNSVIELIKSHRSIRRFKDQALADGVLEELISAGQAASTSSYIQAVSVVRVSDVELRGKFIELTGNQTYVGMASEFLIFCADLERNQQRIVRETQNTDSVDFSWTEQFISATVDVSLFAQNVVIAAQSQGLGCCYIGGVRNDLDQATALLGLPKRVYPVFGLCIGIPDQKPELKPRLPISTVLHENAYTLTDHEHELIDGYDEHVQDYYNVRSKGRLKQTWSQQMTKQASIQTRQFVKDYLVKQGFIAK